MALDDARLGISARRLLAYASRQQPRDEALIAQTLRAVCWTVASDQYASSALIREHLVRDYVAAHGHAELRWLARELNPLITANATLVAEIYIAAFSFEDTSKDVTPMGGGQILPLTSTRRQDYEQAWYKLAEVFPRFLVHAPIEAVTALNAVLEGSITRRHGPEQGKEFEFTVDGTIARMRLDRSYVWDAPGSRRRDHALQMLDAVMSRLGDLAESDEEGDLQTLLSTSIGRVTPAVFWRRLLRTAAHFPSTLGIRLRPLLTLSPLLLAFETSTEIGELLKAAFGLLPESERERVERAILEVANVDTARNGAAARDRLLGCLPRQSLVTIEAKKVWEDLHAEEAFPPNTPPVRISGGFRAVRDEDFLAEQGVDVEADANKRIRDLETPVKTFAAAYRNSPPPHQELPEAIKAIGALHAALSEADPAIADAQRTFAKDTVAEALRVVASEDSFSCKTPEGQFALEVLLDYVRHPDPRPSDESSSQFDEHPSWGTPAVRITASSALMTLLYDADCTTPDALASIEALAQDEIPAVRYQVAQRLVALYRSEPDVFWSLTTRFAETDPSRGVLQGLLGGTLMRVAGVAPERTARLAAGIFRRVADGPGSESVREHCIEIFVGLYVWQNESLSREAVHAIVEDVLTHPDDAGHIPFQLREPLTMGTSEATEVRDKEIRGRAISLLLSLLTAARGGLSTLESRQQGARVGSWPTGEQERAKSMAQLVDQIGREIYFASGAFKGGQAEDRAELTPEQRERFYDEGADVLDELATAGFPSVAHHLVETLETYITIDPQGVLLRIARVVRASQTHGYQFESLAVDLIVRIIERYFAEYRHVLRVEEDSRMAIVDVLDIFVRAGWPAARELAFRMDSIFE
jgi:hypothetical protein